VSEELQALAARCWDEEVASNPLWATVLGDHRFDDRLQDLSAEAEAARISDARAIAAAAEAISEDGLDATDRYTRAMLISQSTRLADVLETRPAEFTVTPMWEGPQAQLLQVAPMGTFPEPEHALALLDRYAAADLFLSQAGDRLREGVAAGRTPPRLGVEQAVAQLDDYLASSLEDDPLLTIEPPKGWDGAATWRERLADVVRDRVRPAMATYRAVLVDEIAPAARPPERSGVCWLPDGVEVYARALRGHITISMHPQEIHDQGHAATADLIEEYATIGSRVFGDTDRAGVFAHLLDDQSLRYTDSAEIVADAHRAMEKAEAAVGAWFGRLPSTRCVVEPQTPAELAGGIFAFYMPPAPDGSRSGSYRINAADPANTTRFDVEAVAYHETLPGHHLQIALAQELDLPEFRRQSETTAYTEGWGLYTERLADEMGLYSSDLDRLGMLAADSLRSSRLVVDTGLHALGWSRDQAIEYMTANTPMPPPPLIGEVDRYIAMPGQAVAYKTGQFAILALRAEAEAALGERFDIRGFHDAVLGEGALSLDVLQLAVRDWIGTAATG
jgi:uncharacterized protein (DUF885 family)